MISLLKLDFKNCLSSLKFKLCFLALWIISIMSYIAIAFGNYNKTSLDLNTTDQLGIINNTGAYSAYVVILIMLPVIVGCIYSDSFIYEKENGITLYYFTRESKIKYFISKIITIFIVVFSAVFISLGINELLTYISYPNIGVMRDGVIYQTIVKNPEALSKFNANLYMSNPFLYNYFLISLISLYAALAAIISFNISLIVNMKRITLMITTFLAVNISMIALPEKFQLQMYIQGALVGGVGTFLTVLTSWLCIVVITAVVGIWRRRDDYA